MTSDSPSSPPAGDDARPSLDPRTQVVHAGLDPDPSTGAVVPPIHLATTYARGGDGQLPGDYIYGRENNPTRERLEQALAGLEGAAGAAAFGSGLAATAAVFSTLGPGARVLLPADRYVGVGGQTDRLLKRWGVEIVEVEPEAPDSLARAVDDSIDLVWIETPSNPRLAVTDVAAAATAARAAGAISVCDATWCTPLVLRPLDLGCDLVVHSTTKYVGGHSDVSGGLVAWRGEAAGAPPIAPLVERVRDAQCLGGGVPSPFDCWLLLRGLRTMALRMRAHAEGASAIAAHLERHPAVSQVLWPGLPAHPGHAVARDQMRSFGGMLSFRLRGGRAAAARVCSATRLFRAATSLGGVESLIEHRAVAEGETTRTPDDLVRVSVGIEAPDDLVADLDAALALV